MFPERLGLRLGNTPSGMEEAREVMAGSHPPYGSVEIAVHPFPSQGKAVLDCQLFLVWGQPRVVYGAKHLLRLMGTFFEDLLRLVRSVGRMVCHLHSVLQSHSAAIISSSGWSCVQTLRALQGNIDSRAPLHSLVQQ